MLGFEVRGGVAAFGLEDMEGDIWVAAADAVDEVEGFLEVVEGVEEDEVHGGGGVKLGEHVDGYEAGEAKGGCLE